MTVRDAIVAPRAAVSLNPLEMYSRSTASGRESSAQPLAHGAGRTDDQRGAGRRRAPRAKGAQGVSLNVHSAPT